MHLHLRTRSSEQLRVSSGLNHPQYHHTMTQYCSKYLICKILIGVLAVVVGLYTPTRICSLSAFIVIDIEYVFVAHGH